MDWLIGSKQGEAKRLIGHLGDVTKRERAAQDLIRMGADAVPSLIEALQMLRARGIQSILAEGGASLTASLLELDVVDRLVLFQAPIVLGAGSLPAFGRFSSTLGADGLRFRPLASERIGDDHLMVFARTAR